MDIYFFGKITYIIYRFKVSDLGFKFVVRIYLINLISPNLIIDLYLMAVDISMAFFFFYMKIYLNRTVATFQSVTGSLKPPLCCSTHDT